MKESKSDVNKLKEIARFLSEESCMCGHNEWCEICSTFSRYGELRKMLLEISIIRKEYEK